MSGHLQRLYAETGHDDEGLQKCLKCALTALHLHDEFGYTMDTSTNGVRHEAWLEYAGGPASALLALFRREIHPPSRLSELEKLQGACAAYRPHNSSSSAQALLFPSAKPLVDLLDGKATTLVVDPYNSATYFGPPLEGYKKREKASRFEPGRRLLDKVKVFGK